MTNPIPVGVRWKVIMVAPDGTRYAPYTHVPYANGPDGAGEVGVWQIAIKGLVLCNWGWHVWASLGAARENLRYCSRMGHAEIWEVEVAGESVVDTGPATRTFWDEKEAWETFRFVRRVK